ncbi:hypothetical protein NE619_12240 [Anaerovorax odorimutans]|uniref:Uncharacterized protein n=1 Tax=Anaerovorax odorimutans TaxID=109327 RepID=A0ABT1RQP0_9FIRM|nr:hypothetical protein [Anaerovorax odorimutans]
MYNQISSRLQSPSFVLAGPFTLNFLLEYIEKLGSEHTYLVVNPSLKRIKKIRQYLSHYDKTPQSLQGFRQDHPNFRPERMTFSSLKYAWEKQGLYVSEKKVLGKTSSKEKHFPRNVVGESVCLYGYMGVKK